MVASSKSFRLAWSVAAAAMIAACSPGLWPHEERAIESWLNCDECMSGERGKVKTIGTRAVPRLERALTNGPDNSRRDLMRRKFEGIYAALVARSPVGVVRGDYVARAESNYIGNYQMRAALSLRDIGGERATNALREASRRTTYRPDVLDAIAQTNTLSDTARFRGVVVPSAVAYGDTVVIRPPGYEPFDGNELVAIDSRSCNPADTPLQVQPNRLAFLVAGPSGVRSLLVCNVGVTTQNQRASLVIRSIYDANDRRMADCTDFACRANRAPRLVPGAVTLGTRFTAKLSLWRTGQSADTIDFFRFEPPALRSVTVVLDWDSTANLDLRWVTCGGAAVGTLDGATGSRPERTTQTIPSGACWLLLVQLQDTTTAVVNAKLEVRSR